MSKFILFFVSMILLGGQTGSSMKNRVFGTSRLHFSSFTSLIHILHVVLVLFISVPNSSDADPIYQILYSMKPFYSDGRRHVLTGLASDETHLYSLDYYQTNSYNMDASIKIFDPTNMRFLRQIQLPDDVHACAPQGRSEYSGYVTNLGTFKVSRGKAYIPNNQNMFDPSHPSVANRRGHLIVVDLNTGEVRHVCQWSRVVSIHVDSQGIFLGTYEKTIIQVDPETLLERQRWSLPFLPTDILRTGAKLYITGLHGIAVIDLNTGQNVFHPISGGGLCTEIDKMGNDFVVDCADTLIVNRDFQTVLHPSELEHSGHKATIGNKVFFQKGTTNMIARVNFSDETDHRKFDLRPPDFEDKYVLTGKFMTLGDILFIGTEIYPRPHEALERVGITTFNLRTTEVRFITLPLREGIKRIRGTTDNLVILTESGLFRVTIQGDLGTLTPIQVDPSIRRIHDFDVDGDRFQFITSYGIYEGMFSVSQLANKIFDINSSEFGPPEFGWGAETFINIFHNVSRFVKNSNLPFLRYYETHDGSIDFRQRFEWISTHDLSNLPDGRVVFSGARILNPRDQQFHCYCIPDRSERIPAGCSTESPVFSQNGNLITISRGKVFLINNP